MEIKFVYKYDHGLRQRECSVSGCDRELLRTMASLRMCRQLSRSLTSASSLSSRGNVASDDLIVWIRLHVVWL